MQQRRANRDRVVSGSEVAKQQHSLADPDLVPVVVSAEQIAAVVKGKLRLIVKGVPHEIGPGEALILPSNVPHAAQVDVETHVIDTFSPPRELPA